VRAELIDTTLGRVRVQIGGAATGPAMLFWPSLLMTGDMWTAQAEHFGETHRVILVDPPGHGGSDRLTATFTFDQCARCIADVLDGLDITTAHIVGNSWGGMIGATFAAAYPDRIGAAVLMNCTASAAGVRQRVEYGALLRAARLLGRIRPPLTRSVLNAFLGPTTFTTRPQVVATVRAQVESVDIDSASWAVRSVVPLRPDQRTSLAAIRTPVLVVAGTEDATFPLPETLAMVAAIPGADVAVLDGVAHLAALENPPLVNTLIDQFLARRQDEP
jgi:3-oxoadipate enol-lactonase